jgi:bifunctional UDP-N-acetylglucosamine pyrophosphorylase / glucosamine-1-phosphate N-acetyltransferase
MEKVSALILAAGMGTRMRSKYPKVIHKVCGRSMINWVISACEEVGIDNAALVTSERNGSVLEVLTRKLPAYIQQEQKGTGHAVMAAVEFIKNNTGSTIILYGDVPLIRPETIKDLIWTHEEKNNDATVLTAKLEEPFGYGRIIRNDEGLIEKIVEQRDADKDEVTIKEINSGIVIYKNASLIKALESIRDDNDQGEYYLTDTIEEINLSGGRAGAYVTNDPEEIMGINDRVQLAEACSIARKRILTTHMLNGVTVEDPVNTYIEADVELEADVVILPGSILEGKSYICADSIIGPATRIKNSKIGQRNEVVNSIIIDSTTGSDTKIGPYSYIRPESVIGDEVKIGDFVEIKKSTIGSRTKISHLTYVGDAFLGENCNLGCGVVVVNYDGKKKNLTKIGDNSFVGCNVNLVSPVELEKDTYIAAGSTITKNVPEKALAIARARQKNLENWVERKNMQRK